MYHVFRATRMGWARKQDGITFDARHYTREEAEACFRPFSGINQRGFPYIGYEYGGVKYYRYDYLGEFSERDLPHSDEDYLDSLIVRNRKKAK